jgi:hypothetical protein
VASSLRSIHHGAKKERFSGVEDIAVAVESATQNAEALFFGLIESKIGGVPLKNELDKKYSEWADLELERKQLPIKEFLKNQKQISGEEKPRQ